MRVTERGRLRHDTSVGPRFFGKALRNERRKFTRSALPRRRAAEDDGDAEAYYEELLALAVDAPDSRAGRRARATLRSADVIGTVMLMNAAGRLFAPAHQKLITSGFDGDDVEKLLAPVDGRAQDAMRDGVRQRGR